MQASPKWGDIFRCLSPKANKSAAFTSNIRRKKEETYMFVVQKTIFLG